MGLLDNTVYTLAPKRRLMSYAHQVLNAVGDKITSHIFMFVLYTYSGAVSSHDFNGTL
jgi:hypothetical protein